jgi:hypothetical protein
MDDRVIVPPSGMIFKLFPSTQGDRRLWSTAGIPIGRPWALEIDASSCTLRDAVYPDGRVIIVAKIALTGI